MKPLFIKKNGTVTKVNPIITLPDNIPASDISYNNTTSGLSSTNVQSAIDEVVNTIDELPAAYHHAGTKTCSELISSLLTVDNEGNVYNITDSGETTSDFIEGSGKPINIGDNVGIAKVSNGVYKFDLLAGMVDTSNFVNKSETAGLIKNDGTIDTNTYLTQHQDISSKADKVTSSTNGNLAGLNGSGNPTDSGWNGAKDTTSISGNPISISGLKANQLAVNPIITLEPIQDLHGQSKPYPAGGGKNKLLLTVDEIKSYNTSGTWNGNTFTYESDSSITFTILMDNANNVIGIRINGTCHGGHSFRILASNLSNGTTYCFSGSPINGTTSTYRGGIWQANDKTYTEYGAGSSFIANGNAVYYECYVYDGATVNNIVFTPMIEEGSTKTSFAPYENICPISGYDKIEVLSCGKNLFDKDNLLLGIVTAGGTINTSNETWRRCYFPVVPNTNYCINVLGYSTFTGYTYATYDKDGVWLETFANIGSVPATITTGSNVYYIAWNCNTSNAGVTQIEEGNQATAYQPYNKTTSISESLGQTVYGSSLDVRTGVLTVDMAIADMGDLTYTYNSQYQYFYTEISSMADSGYGLSDRYQLTTASYDGNQPDNSFKMSGTGNKRMFITNRAYNNATTFKTAMVGAKVAYELATPFTIQLTPHEISLLKDYAYVSTNGTNIQFDYHNGELASLGDVSQLGETVNELGDTLPVLFDNLFVKKIKTTISGNVPTTDELNTIVFPTLGALIVDFYPQNANEPHSSMIYSVISAKYGAGILFSYYSGGIISFVKNNNNTWTISPISYA